MAILIAFYHSLSGGVKVIEWVTMYRVSLTEAKHINGRNVIWKVIRGLARNLHGIAPAAPRNDTAWRIAAFPFVGR